MTMYSFNNTPYSSLGGVMSADIKERTSITSVRFIFSTIGQFVVQGLTLPLVSKFSEDGDKAHGWLCTISLFAAVGLIFLVAVFFSAKERITPPVNQKNNIREDFKDIFSSIPWRSMFILTLFVFITLAMWGSAMNYYFEHYVDAEALYAFLDRLGLVSAEAQDTIGYSILNAFGLIVSSPDKAYEVGFGVFNMLGALVQFFGVILLSNFLANRYGKKNTFIVCLTLTSIFTAMFYFPAQDNIELMFALNFLKSLAYAPTVPLLWAMIADVGRPFGVCQLPPCHRICLCRSGLCSQGWSGYRGCHPRLLIVWIWLCIRYRHGSKRIGHRRNPLIFKLDSGNNLLHRGNCPFFYPITKKYNEKMQAELAERRSKNDY